MRRRVWRLRCLFRVPMAFVTKGTNPHTTHTKGKMKHRPITTEDLVALAVALGTRAERIANDDTNKAGEMSFILNTATSIALTTLGDEIMSLLEKPNTDPKES